MDAKRLIISFLSILITFTVFADEDIGLRIRDNGDTVPIAVNPESTSTSPLKIHKGNTDYGIELVEPDSSAATNAKIKLSNGDIKALKRFSQPVICNSSNIVIIDSRSGNVSCPDGYAGFAIDDTTYSSPYYIAMACCPLPDPSILTGSEKYRDSSCSSNEVATGCYNGRNGKFKCRQIDTTKYTLGSKKTTCYLGHGASGSSGTGQCHTPNQTIRAIIGRSPFGSDACVGNPYGGIIVEKTYKNCGDMKARAIYDKSTGQPIEMFPED
ncbi:MAG: hypothetical protein PHP69_05980 [Candidatus Omnitrophica bacterium]|nr:hypothetical protein [Candidatus Omnitrophota bacterium]MDD5081625.1 hypothetical protein [Candidatus Omnitrophota bacterium]